METFNKVSNKNNKFLFRGANPGLSDFVNALHGKYISSNLIWSLHKTHSKIVQWMVYIRNIKKHCRRLPLLDISPAIMQLCKVLCLLILQVQLKTLIHAI